MSIKPDAAKAAESQFRARFMVLAGGLVLVAILLFALNAVSGPRLRQATLDPVKAVKFTGQRLNLQANQPIKKLRDDQVTIEPTVDFGLTNSANTINLTLKQRLAYDTRYTVRIKDVVAQYGRPRPTVFTYSFKTESAGYYYLKRAGGFDRTDQMPDRIMKSTVSDTGQQIAYSARRIQEFAVVGSKLAVVTANQDGSNQLMMVDTATGKAAAAELPDKGKIDQLRATKDGTKYGFRFTQDAPYQSQMYTNTLFLRDTSPGRRLIPLYGLDSKPLQVSDWQFAPDETSVVAQTSDASLLLFDTRSAIRPTALGRFTEMENFSAAGTKLSVRGQAGQIVLDIPKRSQAKLETAGLRVNGAAVVPLRLQLLSNQEGEALYVRSQDSQGVSIAEHIIMRPAVSPGRQQFTGHTCKATDCLIFDYSMSPNDQYLLVEQAAPQAPYDGYPANYSLNGIGSQLKDPFTGKLLKSIDGSGLQWQ